MAEGRRLTEHYRLDRLVRTGDKGLFFAAVDSRSGQPVAVEMIREAAAEQGGKERARFLATAATLHALDHPSLPKVLDYGFTAAGPS
jgi:serine/threonine protein kinase